MGIYGPYIMSTVKNVKVYRIIQQNMLCGVSELVFFIGLKILNTLIGK